MQIAATTKVYNENVFLEKWLGYYSKTADYLSVVDHQSTDGSVDRAKEKFKFEYHSIEGPHYDVATGRLLTDISEKETARLLKEFDAIIVTDVDEFVIPDPQKFKNLRDYIEEMKSDYVYCTGFDVLHTVGEGSIDWEKPILAQRHYWRQVIRNFKIRITKIPLQWEAGEHVLRGDYSGDFEKKVGESADPSLILAHLRFADAGVERGYVSQKLPVDLKTMEKIPSYFKEVNV